MPSPRRRRDAWSAAALLATLLIALALFSGCRQPPSMPPLPPPPGSTPYSGQGPLATAADLALADLHARLAAHYRKPWDIQRYEMPASTSWQQAVDHYAAALGPDWRVDERQASAAVPGYASRVWSRQDEAVAIAWIEGADQGRPQVLLVLVPQGRN